MPFGYDEDKGEFIEVKNERFYKRETKPETWQKIAPTWEQYLKQQGVTQDDVSKLSPEVASGKYYQPFSELITQQKTPAKDTKDPFAKKEREQQEKKIEDKSKSFSPAEREAAQRESDAAKAIVPGGDTSEKDKAINLYNAAVSGVSFLPNIDRGGAFGFTGGSPIDEARIQKAEIATTPPPPQSALAPTGAVAPTIAPTQPMTPMPSTMGVPMSQETQIQQVLPSEQFKRYQKDLEKSYGTLAEATKIKADAELQDANAMAVASEKAAMQLGQDLESVNKTVSDYKEQLADVRARGDQISQKLENFEIKKFFEGREGAKIMAGISVALGGVAAAFRGGPNTAMQIIQSSIENDLAVQKAQYEKMRGSLDANNTLFGQIRQAGLDETSEKYTFMKTRYDQTIQQAKAIADKISDPERKARINTVIEQLNIQKADVLMKAEENNKRTVITNLKPIASALTPIDREKTFAQFEENIAKSPIQEATDISQAAAKFKELRQMGTTEGALLIAQFIAGKQGLGQGSYSPAFTDALRAVGLFEKTTDEIKKIISGDPSGAVLNAIENFYETSARQSTEKAVEYSAASKFNDRARSVGYDPSYYFNRMHQPTLQKMFNTGGGQGVRRIP